MMTMDKVAIPVDTKKAINQPRQASLGMGGSSGLVDTGGRMGLFGAGEATPRVGLTTLGITVNGPSWHDRRKAGKIGLSMVQMKSNPSPEGVTLLIKSSLDTVSLS